MHPNRIVLQAALVGIVGFLWIRSTAARESDLHSCNIQIGYSVSLQEREGHLCSVELSIKGNDHPYVDFALPAWNNLYEVRDFVRNLREIAAVAEGGEPLPVRQISSHSWRVMTMNTRSLKIRYKVFANHAGDYYTEINQEHAFINGANIFVYLLRHIQVPVTVEFRNLAAEWSLATALPAGGAAYRFQAEDYDHLIDSPIEIGSFGQFQFQLKGVDFRVVYHGRQGLEQPESLETLIRSIVTSAFDLMKDIPLKNYLFIYHFLGRQHGGGMEHRNSTAIDVPPSKVVKDGLHNFLYIAHVTAHEFFHLWNVKRIRPEHYVRVDYSKPIPTPALWFSEGFSSYYTPLIVLRSGNVPKEEFYRRLAGRITALQNRPARLIQSAEAAASSAWRYIDPIYLLPENSIDYYNKGFLLAMLADLKIRSQSQNRRSLDDVMRFMNWYFAKRGIGFRNDDLPWVFSGVAEHDFTEFFERYVTSTEELPYREYLSLAGLELVEKTETVTDFGFFASKPHEEALVVSRVDKGSPADAAGLQVGDLPISGNGKPITSSIDRSLPDIKPGSSITLTVRRGDMMREFTFETAATGKKVYQLREIANPSPLQLSVRNGWLRGEQQ